MASIEEAKQYIKDYSISTIVGYYHPISKRGGNFEGICPFHGDSHPSLKINDSKGIYKCFACGAAGDSIKFVQDKLNLSFIEAIKDIATKIGITIEEENRTKQNPKFEMGLRVIKSSLRLYRKVALEQPPSTFTEFLKIRNITAESVSDFELGYAPGKNAFTSYLNSLPNEQKDNAIKVAMEIGIIRDAGRGPYDFYRDRVMFPIWDHSGTVRGYSSRAVLQDQKPKYLNSGESFIFHKGNILYGLHLAKTHIRSKDAAIVVEGNMDVLALHQFGFKHAVGTMGVAISTQCVTLLKNLTRNIYLGMDNDNAGLIASEKINAMFMQQGLLPRYIDYADNKDPDEFLNAHGRLELSKKIEDAPIFLDFIIEKKVLGDIPSATDAKLAKLREAFELLSPLKEDLMAKEKAIAVAKSLGLSSSPEDVIAAYKEYLEGTKLPSDSVPQTQIADEAMHKISVMAQTERKSLAKITTSEKFPLSRTESLLLESLITFPVLLESQLIGEILDLVDHLEVKKLIQWLSSIYMEIDDSEYLAIVRSVLEDDEYTKDVKDIVARGLFTYSGNSLESKVAQKMMQDFVFQLKRSKLRFEKSALILQQGQCVQAEDSLELMQRIQDIDNKLFQLQSNRS